MSDIIADSLGIRDEQLTPVYTVMGGTSELELCKPMDVNVVAAEQDEVSHPSHYAETCVRYKKAECIDITRYLDFDLGNAVKYIWRAGKKDKDKKLQDLEKALWYLNDFLEDTTWQYEVLKTHIAKASVVYQLIHKNTLVASVGPDLAECLDYILSPPVLFNRIVTASQELAGIVQELKEDQK